MKRSKTENLKCFRVFNVFVDCDRNVGVRVNKKWQNEWGLVCRLTVEKRGVHFILSFIQVDHVICSLIGALRLDWPKTFSEYNKCNKSHGRYCCHVGNERREFCTNLVEHGPVKNTFIVTYGCFVNDFSALPHYDITMHLCIWIIKT